MDNVVPLDRIQIIFESISNKSIKILKNEGHFSLALRHTQEIMDLFSGE